MTSRTTKQAARAYQKAHGVPYAEALRRVMETETPPAEAAPHEHIAGGPGVGKGPFVGTPIEPTFEPVRFDPMTWLETAEQFDGEGSDAVHFSVTGQLGSGSTIGARSRQSIQLGTVDPASISSTLDHDAIPATWAPWKAKLQGNPPSLGVYGPHGHGKTVFLATLANRYKHAMPITVVTAFPDAYPDDDLIKIVHTSSESIFTDPSALLEHTNDATAKWAERTGREDSTDEFLPVLILDPEPTEREEIRNLRRFLRSTRAWGLAVFYTGPGDHGPNPSLARYCTDVAVILHRTRGNWLWRDRETPLRLAELFPPEEAFTGRQ